MSAPTRNSRFSKKSTSSNRGSVKANGRPSGSKKGPKTARSGSSSAGLRPKKRSSQYSGRTTPGQDWIWGNHAALAALENRARTIHEILITEQAARRIDIPAFRRQIDVRSVSPQELDAKLGGVVHQGIALRAAPPPDSTLDAMAEPASGLILVLDQITDPHNVGAMFRLCAAFGARGVIMQDRKAPPLSGATAKVAVGCVESVPHALVSNIANTLLDLRDRGWIVTGLAGDADRDIARAVALPKNADAPANVIVMGAEGPGLRPRVRDCCDHLARIPMPGGAESLNVATAAAIALYEAVRESESAV